MLAHLKAREMGTSNNGQENEEEKVGVSNPESGAYVPSSAVGEVVETEDEKTMATCDVLCSLSASFPPRATDHPSMSMAGEEDFPDEDESSFSGCEMRSSKSSKSPSTNACPKNHQLPMFLSKTYHMIDRCDPSIATWSVAGDNFVVKNVEQFASHVLPLYFKHSNFSSFARQLNFYGFRKLRTDPILTSEVDPQTACYVRFYHEKFQKDRPELLHQIKRATKSDQQSKDDVDTLKSEVCKLKDCITNMSCEMDRKLGEMSYEYNRRISNLSAEYDKLAGLVTQILARTPETSHSILHQHQQPTHQPAGTPHEAMPSSVSFSSPSHPGPSGSGNVPDLMHSLSQVAAMSLQNQLRHPPPPSTTTPATTTTTPMSTLGAVVASNFSSLSGSKRSASPPSTNTDHPLESSSTTAERANVGTPSSFSRPRTQY